MLFWNAKAALKHRLLLVFSIFVHLFSRLMTGCSIAWRGQNEAFHAFSIGTQSAYALWVALRATQANVINTFLNHLNEMVFSWYVMDANFEYVDLEDSHSDVDYMRMRIWTWIWRTRIWRMHSWVSMIDGLFRLPIAACSDIPSS